MQQVKSLAVEWMVGKDRMPVLGILDTFHSSIRGAADLVKTLSQRNSFGLVAKINKDVVGCAIYELHKKSVQVVAFGIRPDMRRRGIGSLLMAALKAKLSAEKRWMLDFVVHDSELDGHLFLRSQGFVAVEVLREMYEDGDAYRFRYRCLDA